MNFHLVLITNLVILFSAAGVNYAAAELDCRGGHSSCSSGCNRMPPDFKAGCEHSCWDQRNTCERTNERERLNEQRLREERSRQGSGSGSGYGGGGSGYGSPGQYQWPNHKR